MNTNENPASEDRGPQNTESSLTSVKTVYARAAIILLAVNFAFTGYLTYSMNQIQSELVDSMQGVAATKAAGANSVATLSTTKTPAPQSADSGSAQEIPETRDK